MTPLTLKVQNARPIESPTWQQIERAFAKWDTLRRGFFILSDASGNYVQTAGASYKATVELREVRPDGTFSHYVLGRAEGSRAATSIFTSAGTVRLNENEIFSLPEVLEIFRAFFDDRGVPDRFTRRDDTSRFASA
jgi:hypothetical protein